MTLHAYLCMFAQHGFLYTKSIASLKGGKSYDIQARLRQYLTNGWSKFETMACKHTGNG